MFNVVKFKNNKSKSNRGKKKITWVFWKSHVSELCEKWTYYNNNYAYTRFEEFRTCLGEVVFTNEHKAVFSKNNAKTYIDINDLNIFKDFCKKDKTKFKRKLKTKMETNTTETIKMIMAEKDKDIKGNCTAKIKEYAHMISDIYDLQQETKEKITDKIINTQNLLSEFVYAKNQNNLVLMSEILEMIDAVFSDGLNIVWNMVCKQNKKNNEKITVNKQKDIRGYSRKLQKIIKEKTVLLETIMQKMESSITTTKNNIDRFNEKLHKLDKINKANLQLIEGVLAKKFESDNKKI